MPQEITRVFLNLLNNGFYAANKRRQQTEDLCYRPVLKVSTHELGSEVEIKMHDNGIGIEPELRDKLFTPFFTTKPAGEGTGLGPLIHPRHELKLLEAAESVTRCRHGKGEGARRLAPCRASLLMRKRRTSSENTSTGSITMVPPAAVHPHFRPA